MMFDDDEFYYPTSSMPPGYPPQILGYIFFVTMGCFIIHLFCLSCCCAHNHQPRKSIKPYQGISRPMNIIKNHWWNPAEQKHITSNQDTIVVFTPDSIQQLSQNVLRESNFRVNIHVKEGPHTIHTMPTDLHSLVRHYSSLFYLVLDDWLSTSSNKTVYELQQLLESEFTDTRRNVQGLEIVFRFLFLDEWPTNEQINDQLLKAHILKEAKYLGVPELMKLCCPASRLLLYPLWQAELFEQYHYMHAYSFAPSHPFLLSTSDISDHAILPSVLSGDFSRWSHIKKIKQTSVIQAYEQYFGLIDAHQVVWPSSSSSSSSSSSASSSAASAAAPVLPMTRFSHDREYYALPPLLMPPPPPTKDLEKSEKEIVDVKEEEAQWMAKQEKLLKMVTRVFGPGKDIFLNVTETAGPIDCFYIRPYHGEKDGSLIPSAGSSVRMWRCSTYLTLPCYILHMNDDDGGEKSSVTIRLIILRYNMNHHLLSSEAKALFVLSHIALDCDACVLHYDDTKKMYWLPRTQLAWQTKVIPYRAPKDVQSFHLMDDISYLSVVPIGYRIAIPLPPTQPESDTKKFTSSELWFGFHFLSGRVMSSIPSFPSSSSSSSSMQSVYHLLQLHHRKKQEEKPSDAMSRESMCLPFPFRGIVIDPADLKNSSSS